LAREQRKLAAILAADVVGYSRLMGRDESGTLARLREHRKERLEPALARYGGRLVKLTGDGALVEFASAVDALSAAIEFQQAVSNGNLERPEAEQIVFRVGIHVGDLIVDGDDLYGDGVNIAARLEAEAPPGGIIVSRAVREAVEGRLKARLQTLGDLTLKNIERPIRAFRVEWEAADWPSAAAAPKAVDELEPPAAVQGRERRKRKAALAVLPFTVFGGDSETETLADGLVEDILTALARFRLVSIIARNSTFAYRGQQIDIRRAAAELGADYVLEGSVRRSGNNVRVSAQLIDAADGAHLWAERYDRRVDNLFAVQDVIAQAIVAGVEQPLVTTENRRGAPDPVGSTTDVIKAAGWYLFRFDRASNNKAISLLLSGAAENPAAYRRHQALAMGYCWQMAFGWTEKPAETAERALAASETAIGLNDEDAWNYCVLGWSAVYCDQFERGLAAVQRAVQINPNSAVTHGVRGWVLAHAGDSEGAIDAFATTARLGLQHPFIFMHATGAAWACFAREAWEEAAQHAEMAALRRPNCFGPHVVLAAISGLRGDERASAQSAEAIRHLIPQFSLAWLGGFLHLRSTNLRERAYEGLRAAGIE
jgi:adenylate cyclase